MRRAAFLLAAMLGACTTAPRPPEPVTCEWLFQQYDTVVRLYPVTRYDEDWGLVPRGPESRWVVALRSNGCLTTSEDLDGLPALAARLMPLTIASGGPAIPPTPVHLGIVMSNADEAFVSRYFRGFGYRSRGIGAEGLGRRIYIGPFTDQAALDQALAIAREAGFIAPYPAVHTRF